MKAIIWKELRENLKWAALAFLCLLLAEIYALHTQGNSAGDSTGSVTLCGSTFLMVSVLGCALVGAALGAVQILPELRRDQWASLLHRPVPRGVIFLGKVVAGLALYLMATGVPLLVSTAYAAWPGAFPAPLVPGLLRPALSDVLLGAVFYFAALLAALHRGRWFGARGAISIAAIATLGCHLTGGWPFALPAFAALIFFGAGHGAMLGPVSARPWAARLAFLAVTLTGAQAALIVCGALLQLLPQKKGEREPYIDFAITKEGQVFIITETADQSSTTLTDTDGQPVTEPRDRDPESSRFLQTLPFASRNGLESMLGVLEERQPRSSQRFVSATNWNFDGPEYWYLLRGRQSHFVGYDALSARCIGICDAEGFKKPGFPLKPFANEPLSDMSASPPFLYWVGPRLFAFDFADRRVTPVFDAGSETIFGATRLPPNREESKYLVVALTSGLRILDDKGTVLRSFPYGHETEAAPQMEIASTDDLSRIFIKYSPNYYTKDFDKMPTYLDVIGPDGGLQHTYQLPKNRTTRREMPVTTRLARLLLPPVPSLVATLATRGQSPSPTLWRSGFFGEIRGLTNGELTALTGVALFLGLLEAFIAHRTHLGLRPALFRVAMSVLFGFAGLLASRLAAPHPARIRCPRCARPRSVQSATCGHCHEAWPPPPPTGAEIFESPVPTP
jgi:hypothetical protein